MSWEAEEGRGAEGVEIFLNEGVPTLLYMCVCYTTSEY